MLGLHSRSVGVDGWLSNGIDKPHVCKCEVLISYCIKLSNTYIVCKFYVCVSQCIVYLLIDCDECKRLPLKTQ